ncbi:hypothetical protein EDD11_001802 [Mortierella claussenii]|nr:hypothetical protein EDD11_001802 [Mortierella claussenii]
MYLPQHQQQVQEQWLLEQQQTLQLQAQQHQQLQSQHENLSQDGSLSHQLTRKRGLASEAEVFTGIKKRHLDSERAAQGLYPEMAPDTPGSVISDLSADHSAANGGGYFDQPFFSSSAGTSPHYLTPSFTGFGGASSGASALSTSAGPHFHSSASSSSSGSSAPTTTTMVPSSGSSLGWNTFKQQQQQAGSHSSPSTPHITALPNGSSSGSTASTMATNIFSSTFTAKEPLEYRLLQEQKKLHETQLQEQQRLQFAQQQELLDMQRQQEEQSKAAAMLVHHDHNDPATWGYDGASVGQFTSYLGGHGRGYTPAAIGGVAALAAMAAASKDTHSAGRSGGTTGMDMDM